MQWCSQGEEGYGALAPPPFLRERQGNVMTSYTAISGMNVALTLSRAGPNYCVIRSGQGFCECAKIALQRW